MSLDQIASLSQIATFVVIGATAVIGFVQLRHLRNANRVEFMRGLSQDYEGVERREAFQFVRSELADRLRDPSFRTELRSGRWDRSKHPEMNILNLFETWGRYYREGVVAREPFIASFCRVVTGFWDLLEPVVALVATRTNGENQAFGSFEYLTVQARSWMAKHPHADYPSGAPRIPLTDQWAEEDRDPPGKP